MIINQQQVQCSIFGTKYKVISLNGQSLHNSIQDSVKKKEPFFLLINFKADHFLFYTMDQLLAEGIWVQFPNFSNVNPGITKPIQLQKNPVSFATYQQAFDIVKKHLLYGNSYLTNLTFATPVACEEGLRDLFDAAQAKYKILFKDEWVCFSPETFITITENHKI